MPPWPAQASGDSIVKHAFTRPSALNFPAAQASGDSIVKHVFTRPSGVKFHVQQGLKPRSSRNAAIPRRSGRPNGPGDKNPWRKLPLLGELRNDRNSHRITRMVFNFANPRSLSEVKAAILDQLPTLELQLATKRAAGEDRHTNIAAFDPDNSRWQGFETEMRHLIEEGAKEMKGNLSTEQQELYRKLYTAQTAGKNSSLLPRTEVVRHLEFAYYNYILQSNKKSTTPGSLVFNPIEEYTDLRYPTEWYSSARTTQRQIHLHVGPTNSGKTYNAIKRLEEAGNGYYCGPLRLLAHEVYARFQAKGIPCHLITGDDVRTDPADDVELRASTVEMVDTNAKVDVAVIDEIQMMAHEERGWAWTRAFLGSNAKEVHLCGEARVIPLIRELSASMGDALQVHNYERLSPLKVMSKSLRGNLKLLRKGDCVVSFSVVGIHALKKEIEKFTGRRVAIVYGSLPPETRTAQADLFNNPDNDYDFLVASDAIGMGLNLAVKRIIFESVYKHNGRMREILSIPQIKQIAGRAGRYRTARQGADADKDKQNGAPPPPPAIGLVTCMEEADLPIIQNALQTEPEPIKAAGLLPPTEFVEEFAARLPKGLPFEYIYQRVCDIARMHPRFKLSEISSQTGIARVLDSVKNLTIKDRLCFSSSPANTRKQEDVKLLIAYGRCVANNKPVSCVDIPEIPLEVLDVPMSGSREYLQGLESLHQSLILYLWLSYRFVAVFKDRDQAMYAKTIAEQRISETLTKFSHTAELKERMKQLKLRQIKDSNILAELDPGTSDEMPLVLSSDEPNTEDIPVEPTALPIEELETQDLSGEAAILNITTNAGGDAGEDGHLGDGPANESTITNITTSPSNLTYNRDAVRLSETRLLGAQVAATHLANKGSIGDLPTAGNDGGSIGGRAEVKAVAAAGS
jgi:ATP-dependent RNA helicase SUPV3L1/SUV3